MNLLLEIPRGPLVFGGGRGGSAIPSISVGLGSNGVVGKACAEGGGLVAIVI